MCNTGIIQPKMTIASAIQKSIYCSKDIRSECLGSFFIYGCSNISQKHHWIKCLRHFFDEYHGYRHPITLGRPHQTTPNAACCLALESVIRLPWRQSPVGAIIPRLNFSGDHPLQFSDFSLDKRLLQSLKHMGIETPTPIQSQAIPVAMSGRDLMASSKTGSGKTLAFCCRRCNG